MRHHRLLRTARRLGLAFLGTRPATLTSAASASFITVAACVTGIAGILSVSGNLEFGNHGCNLRRGSRRNRCHHNRFRSYDHRSGRLRHGRNRFGRRGGLRFGNDLYRFLAGRTGLFGWFGFRFFNGGSLRVSGFNSALLAGSWGRGGFPPGRLFRSGPLREQRRVFSRFCHNKFFQKIGVGKNAGVAGFDPPISFPVAVIL